MPVSLLRFIVVLLLLAGCAPKPVVRTGGDELLALPVWTQLGPNDALILRAVVPAGASCPVAEVDGVALAMSLRAAATPSSLVSSGNLAFRPIFDVVSCELGLPADACQVSVAGRSVALGRRDGATRRIVVLGDTGCRIKVPAKGAGDPIQDCSDPHAWPWARIAAAAASTDPDLVIHVGDYHYREYCEDPLRCDRIIKNGTVVGYGWGGWQADFFTPAAPLLGKAPWVFVRGNHENCDRGGEGWMRFFAPTAYGACSDQRYRSESRSVLGNNFTADAYRIDIDAGLGLVVADNAGHEDFRPASATSADLDLFRSTLAILRETRPEQQLWLLSHRPLWYDLPKPESQPNAFQAALHRPPPNLQIVFSGHEHAFETLTFPADADLDGYPEGRPAQVVVGNSGTQLESLDPQSSLYEGTNGAAGSKERASPGEHRYEGVTADSGILLNRYGFLLLERDSNGWAGTVMDADGRTLSRCRLNGKDKQFECQFPGH